MEGLPKPSAEITPDNFKELFKDLMTMPSYLEIAQAKAPEAVPDVQEWYHNAVDAARERIYEYPETTKHQEHADRMLLNHLFGGSDGAEARMVFHGFKPVALIGLGFRAKDIARGIGTVPFEYTFLDSILADIAHPKFGYYEPIQEEDDPSTLYHTGFLFNKDSVESVARLNADMLEQLGHDPELPASQIVEEVFGSSDYIAQSILMGYSPFTAVYFYIKVPSDLESWRATVEPSPIAPSLFWENIEKIMTQPQLEATKTLADDTELLESLSVLDAAISNKDYIYRNDKNTIAQEALALSGTTAYVHSMRLALYGKNDKFHKNML